ncbi:MAG: heme exporter protein CcmD [Gammaproteobacteria bacterium]|nr:heme exporter protein CcmD [Gammaproteobacteria bacterium]
MKEFFHMGGYGFYVWLSYGIAAVVLISNIILPVYQRKSMLNKLAKKIKRAEQLK